MKRYMLRPYPRRNELCIPETLFNYRLSRARRVIKNYFEILASRFRIYRKPIIAKVENVISIIKAITALHNFLIKTQSQLDNFSYCPSDFVDQESEQGRVPSRWRHHIGELQGIILITRQESINFTRRAKLVRDNFKQYFNSEKGALSWQDHAISSTSNPFHEECL